MLQSLGDAFLMLGALDHDVMAIAWLSLRVSVSAVLLGSLVAIPLGALLAIVTFPGRPLVVAVVNAFMGLPPVLVGLIVYLLLSRSGPLGSLRLLFTPGAMILAQTVLAIPLLAALTRQIVEDAHRELDEQLRSLRLDVWQRTWTLVFHLRFSLVVALLAAFGRAISEVGAVLVVGGNIDGYTRTMTTAMSLETQKGDLPFAIALGILLIAIVLMVNATASAMRAYTMRLYP
jgi:tungstate transport system permease protein